MVNDPISMLFIHEIRILGDYGKHLLMYILWLLTVKAGNIAHAYISMRYTSCNWKNGAGGE